MPHGAPRPRRARPVADAPIDALLLHADELAKGWLLALLEAAPLDAAPRILAADLARDGPRVCEAVVRALGADGDLRRLEPGGALEPLVSDVGRMAGAAGPVAVSAAVDGLRAVIWTALRAELPTPDPEQIAALAERLALVTDLVRRAALRDAGATDLVESDGTGWFGALEAAVECAKRGRAPLALLLVELEDARRVPEVEAPMAARATLGRFVQAVRTVMRHRDILASESDTRAWVIARETSRVDAQALADRAAAAVRAAEPWRGAPMTVRIGIAVLGEDGPDAEALVGAAESQAFAAAASGIAVGRDRGTDGDGEPPIVA